MPSDWQVHHVMQQRLAAHYLAERGINVHTMSNLRGVPGFVHSEITAAQNAWWREMAEKHNWTPANIPLSEVDKFNAKLDAEFGSRWVTVGASRSQINSVKNLAKNRAAAQFGLDKGNRWKRLGLAITGFAFFNLVTTNAKAFERMRNFDADTDREFGDFMTAYENCLTENIQLGRVKQDTGGMLLVTFGKFARKLNMDERAVNSVETAMGIWVDTKLFP